MRIYIRIYIRTDRIAVCLLNMGIICNYQRLFQFITSHLQISILEKGFMKVENV